MRAMSAILIGLLLGGCSKELELMFRRLRIFPFGNGARAGQSRFPSCARSSRNSACGLPGPLSTCQVSFPAVRNTERYPSPAATAVPRLRPSGP